MFPLPYRLSTLLVLGVWGWGLNLHYLQKVGINVPTLLRYPTRSGSAKISHHQSTYSLATGLSGFLALSFLLHSLITSLSPAAEVTWQGIPNLTLIAILAAVFLPRNVAAGNGRRRIRAMFRRISLGRLARDKDGRFADVLLSDALTSYSKVIVDLAVVVCLILTGGNTCTAQTNRMCGGWYLVPVISGIPAAIRLRQCLLECHRARADGGTGYQHLANALKYSTAFPGIILVVMMKGRYAGDGLPGPSLETLARMWWVAVLINTSYSFYWDVTKDWDLTLFSDIWEFLQGQDTQGSEKGEGTGEKHFGLRKNLLFNPNVYYAAVAIDLTLRCLPWALRVYSPELHGWFTGKYEPGIFTIQALEIARRWVWAFVRIETECVRYGVPIGKN